MLEAWRLNFFVFFVLALAGLIFYRLSYLAYQRHDYFSQLALTQYQSQAGKEQQRGRIYASDHQSGRQFLLASQKTSPFIYAIPRAAKDAEASAQKLAAVFNFPLARAQEIFNKQSDPFELVISQPQTEEIEKARQWSDPDLAIGYEPRRYYPERTLFSQTLGFLGFVGDKRQGQYGLEEFYEGTLTGEQNGEGNDLVLTVDKNVQLFVEQELDYLIDRWRPESGLIMVQDPQNGQILAMAGSPSYDPNAYYQFPLSSFVNKSIQEMFEPGSSFKPITVAAALDQKKITPGTRYYDSGEVTIANYQIKNFNEKSFGWQTMNEVLEKSLNTGAIFVQDQLGDQPFLDYVLNFGFGQITGVDLAGEAAGDISNLYSQRKINFATASFGQGIAVTPLQLINSYSALANGGKLYRPFLVKEIIKPNGEKEEIKPELLSTPISERTSSQIKAMLVGVVERGFDKATVPGYEVAGKTGTAQIASVTGGYSEDFIHNVVGFGPAFSPRFTVLIKLDKPQGIRFAADSLSPSLGKIMSFLFNYFAIPPTK